MSCSQTGGVHDQREARVPDGQRPHQHVRSDLQEHRLRRSVHPRGRHQGPVKAAVSIRPLPASCTPQEVPPHVCPRTPTPPRAYPDLWLVELQQGFWSWTNGQTFFFPVLTWRYKPLGGAMILIQHLNAHSQVSLPAELHMFMCRSWFSSLHVQVVFDFVRFKSFLLTNVHSDFCLPCNNLYHLEKDLTWRVCTIEQNAVNVNRCNHCWRSHYDLLKPLNSRQSSQVQ